ncbi:MAG: DNA-3-methyladenine glycosylase I [Acidimicrobiales bacterium]
MIDVDGLRAGDDGRTRCWWPGDDPLYVAYHDEEWGRPSHGEQEQFELLCLEGAQAGLSWITILRRRDGYRRAFDGFDPETVAGYGPEDVDRLLGDAGIIRNRAKVESAIGNARALLAMHEAGESLDELIWSYGVTAKRPRSRADIATTTPAAEALSKDLKRRGFRFVGPTIVYAHLQSAGVVDDHIAGCWCVDGQ